MELPLLSTRSLSQYTQQCKEMIHDFFAPLDQEAFNYFYLDNQQFTMPFNEIQTLLNQHYVTMEPLKIVYNSNTSNQCQQITAQVLSPLTYDKGVKLVVLTTGQHLTLSAQAILKVYTK